MVSPFLFRGTNIGEPQLPARVGQGGVPSLLEKVTPSCTSRLGAMERE